MSGSDDFTPDEELSEICSKLWLNDENYCVAGQHYEIDIQGYVTSTRNTSRDRARDHLFDFLDEETVFERPTFKAFRALLDNYETETGHAEEVTQQEHAEEVRFIDLIMETTVMQMMHEYLVSKDKAPEELNDFKRLLYKLWFKLYKRQRQDKDLDSCGFEHVFVGETRDGSVIGFHNWVQTYLQEKRGNVDYRGYFRRGTSDEESPKLITLQFMWKKSDTKPIGSSFMGTSPEFEIALYTLVHLMDKGDKVPINIAGYEVEIHCFPHGRDAIGTAYPMSKCD